MKNFTTLIFLLLLSSLFNFISAQIAFTDIAPALGVNNPGAGQGAVFLDIDNDGFPDLCLVNNGQANRLRKSNSGTTFTEIGAAWGVN